MTKISEHQKISRNLSFPSELPLWGYKYRLGSSCNFTIVKSYSFHFSLGMKKAWRAVQETKALASMEGTFIFPWNWCQRTHHPSLLWMKIFLPNWSPWIKKCKTLKQRWKTLDWRFKTCFFPLKSLCFLHWNLISIIVAPGCKGVKWK